MPSERWIQPIWQERQRVTKKVQMLFGVRQKKESSDQTEHGVTNTQEKMWMKEML